MNKIRYGNDDVFAMCMNIKLMWAAKIQSDFQALVDEPTHAGPRILKLGSVEALSHVDFRAAVEASSGCGELCEVDFSAADADLRDGFYQMEVSRLAAWFGVNEVFTAELQLLVRRGSR